MNATAIIHPATTTTQIQHIATTRITDLINEFISHLDVKPSSRSTYRKALVQYFTWIESTGTDLATATKVDVLRFKDHICGKVKNTTAVSYITAVRKFYAFTESMKYYPNIAAGVRPPKVKDEFTKEPFTADQVRAMITAIDCSRVDGARDHAILILMATTGLRTIEIIRLDVEDLTKLNGHDILRVHGKGKDAKDDFVIIPSKALEAIAIYLRSRGNITGSAPLFCGHGIRNNGQRISTRTVRNMVQKIKLAAGIDDPAGVLTAHSLRHFFGTEHLRRSNDLAKTQAEMRHESQRHTKRYTKQLEKERRFLNAINFDSII